MEELEREHLRAAVARIDLRDADVRVTGEVRAEAPRVPGLGAVVELLADRAGELVDQADCVDEAQRLDALPGEARCLVEEDEVGLDLGRSGGTLHLDGDLAPVGKHSPMHLADRRRRDRGLVELEKELLDGQPELSLDRLFDLRERKRPYVILQRP